ncbi:MAG: hydrolase [Sphingomonas bacterium]|nr:hydrolase [Sphingomonas bacterium]
MNTGVLEKLVAKPPAKLGIVDCDIHPSPQSMASLFPFMSERWRTHAETFGFFAPAPFVGHSMFAKSAPSIARRDAWPESGPPGSDLALMQRQHLDLLGIEHGMLTPLSPNPGVERNLDFAAALASAVNDWQLAEFTDKDKRLHPAIVVPREDPEAAVKEIERCAKDGRYAQLMLRPHGLEPFGRRRYWPVFEAAVAHGLPVGVHAGGYGAYPLTSAGWPSFYIEEHLATTVGGGPALATSLIFEGVFDRFPDLKVVFIENGFAWIPSVGWRLDRLWERNRAEVPHVKRPPSEYLRSNCWFTTQPIEEPARPADLRQIFDWIGWDRLLFSSDYPHWDSDDPAYMFPIQISSAERSQIMRDNALHVYGHRF